MVDVSIISGEADVMNIIGYSPLSFGRLGLEVDGLTEVAIGAALTPVTIAIVRSESLILLAFAGGMESELMILYLVTKFSIVDEYWRLRYWKKVRAFEVGGLVHIRALTT